VTGDQPSITAGGAVNPEKQLEASMKAAKARMDALRQ
jgi:hypothetical protein